MKKYIHIILQILPLLTILSTAQAQQWHTANGYIYTNTKVGINTSSPDAKLHVEGGSIRVNYANGPQSRWGQAIEGSMVFTTTSNHDLVLGAGNTRIITIKPDGKIGFGTAAPDYRMHVTGKTCLNGVVGIGTIPDNNNQLTVKGSVHVSNSAGSQVFHVSAGKELVFIGTEAYNEYLAAQSDTSNAIHDNNYSLWVSKGIISEDFALAPVNDWADYVFDESYALPSLQNLEAFIQQYKHLPSIPSEATVKKSGYSIHALNRGFLKTVEELTLYAIDQDKKLRTLEDQVASQAAMLKQLVDEIAAMKQHLSE